MTITQSLVRNLVHGHVRGLTDDWFTSGASLTAPVLTWVSDVDDNTPLFEADFTDLQENDVGRLQIDDDIAFGSPIEATNTADAAEVLALQLDYTTGALADGQWWARVRHERGASVSAWSNVETKTIAAASNLLLEAGDDILLEAGDLILLEAA